MEIPGKKPSGVDQVGDAQQEPSPSREGRFLRKRARAVSASPQEVLRASEDLPVKRSRRAVSLEPDVEHYRSLNALANVEAHAFATYVASDNEVYGEDFFKDFFALNSVQYPTYGTALVFLYAVMQHHGQADEGFSELLAEAVRMAGADKEYLANMPIVGGEGGAESSDDAMNASLDIAMDMIDCLVSVRPLRANAIDQALKDTLYGAEDVMEAFRLIHYDRGHMKFLDEGEL